MIPGDPEQPLGDPVEVARQICLSQLEARSRSRAELEQTLAKRGVPVEAGRQVLDRLTAVGLVDDKAFAELWVRSRHRERGLARATLRQELHRKGIAPEVVDDALSELGSDEEAAMARRLVERKLSSTSGLPPQTRVRRLVSLLARKGYPPGTAFGVVRAVLKEAEDLELADDALL